MATWEDGPEYAPLERPDAFRGPDVPAGSLEPPPPAPVSPADPVERPAFTDPEQAVPPLAELVPAPPAQRDPNTPFEVASSVLTAESSAWAAVHWAPPQAPPAQPPAGPFQAGPFQAGPVPAPTTVQQPDGHRPPNPAYPAFPPPTGSPAHPPSGGSFPAPGTPQWFVPGPYQPPAPPPAPPVAAPTARGVLAAATPGVVITLGVGSLIWVLAPVTVVVAFLLSGRMTYGRKPTRTAFSAVLAFIGLVGLLAVVTADGVFSQWWATVAGWACFGSWVLLVAVLIATYQAIKQGRPDPPPTPRVPLR